MIDRSMPFSEEAERAVVGSLMLEGAKVFALAVNVFGLAPEAFWTPALRLVAEACWEIGLRSGGMGIDLLTVTQRLRDAGTLDAAGGTQCVEKALDETPTASHAEYYLRIMRDKWLLRKTIEGAQEIVQEAYGQVENPELFAAAAPERLMGIVNVSTATEPDDAGTMMELIGTWRDAKAFEQDHDQSKKLAIGHATPWQYVTRLIGGLEPGLTIIGGRPSAGKTTLEDMFSHHVAKLGIPVGRITLDSSRKALLSRAMCREAEVSLPKLKGGYSREDELQHLDEAARLIAARPIKIRTDLRDIASIRMWALNEHRRHGLGMLTVDYIQQVTAAELGWQSGNALARTTHVIGQFKALSLELNIPVLVLSQLSRPPKDKAGKAPGMQDLRDSGALEQDAEKILLLSIDEEKRDAMELALPESTKKKRPVMLTLAKNKDGVANMGVELWLMCPYFRFDLAQQDWVDDQMMSGHETINGPRWVSDVEVVREPVLVPVPHMEDHSYLEGFDNGPE